MSNSNPESEENSSKSSSSSSTEEQLVCDACFEQNLTSNVHIQKCVICSEPYCGHHASTIDPSHCGDCLYDVTVQIDTITKIESSSTSAEAGSVTRRTRKARQIKIGGLHWLFVQRKIPDLTEEELTLAIEYHRGLYDGLIYEREVRRSEHLHRNAGKQVKIPSISNTETTITTTVKKSRVTKSLKPDKAAANFASAIQELMKHGLSVEQIKTAIAAKK